MESIYRAPGVRFHPSEVELVMYYLKKQINRRPHVKLIAVVELYKFEPWDLQAQSLLRSRDLEWYFFCPRDRKYASGSRRNRATEKGFWKTTGNDKAVCYDSKTVGMRKTLIFYEGKAPKGTRTDWVMHEYRIEDKGQVDAGCSQDAYVLCKIFKKSGRGPKNGEQHGAQFNEADWEDDLANDSCISLPLADPTLLSHEPEVNQNMAIKSTLDSQNGDNSLLEHLAQNSGTHVISEGHPSLLEDDDTENFDSDKLLSQLDNDGDALMSNGSGINEVLDSSIPHKSTDEDVDHHRYHEIYDELEDIISGDYLELKDLPDHEMDNSRSNPEQREAIYCCTSPCMENAEETAALSVPQFMARGEQHKPSSLSLEHRSSVYLLDCIPGGPATSAEYPYPLREEYLKDGVPCDWSSIGIKAEVTVSCLGIDGPIKESSLHVLSLQAIEMWVVAASSYLWFSWFMFVILLGMVSVLMSHFLFGLGAKLGRYVCMEEPVLYGWSIY